MRLAAEIRLGGTLRIWRRAYGIRPALERARWALDRVGLADRAATPAGRLAHGDKRKLELAMVLARDPRVILLDEPMAGVSMEDVPGLVEVITSVQREEGKTVLMVEHHIEVVTGVADRIAVMHHGALLACDTPARVMDERDRPGRLRRGAAVNVPRNPADSAGAGARSPSCGSRACTSTSASRTCSRA